MAIMNRPMAGGLAALFLAAPVVGGVNKTPDRIGNLPLLSPAAGAEILGPPATALRWLEGPAALPELQRIESPANPAMPTIVNHASAVDREILSGSAGSGFISLRSEVEWAGASL